MLSLYYPSNLINVTPKIIKAYESSEAHLNEIFKWRSQKKVQLIVINNRQQFLKIAEHPLTVAFADINRNRIIIDYSQVIKHPFSLETTLQHELCHILLHQYISSHIPRWLDEGIAQWTSEGIAEIIHPETNLLQRSAFSNKLIPFYKLSTSFPMETTHFILAYEQSKSFVSYLVNTYSKNNLLHLLDHAKVSNSFHDSAHAVYGKSLQDLEREWIKSITHYIAWLLYISNNIYTFIFIGMAFLCIYAFIRLKIKQRNYTDDWDDDFDFEMSSDNPNRMNAKEKKEANNNLPP
jgi:hypothetical protein